MAMLTHKDRLQPSLLDRLSDERRVEFVIRAREAEGAGRDISILPDLLRAKLGRLAGRVFLKPGSPDEIVVEPQDDLLTVKRLRELVMTLPSGVREAVSEWGDVTRRVVYQDSDTPETVFLDMKALRKAVLRDLAWLFNASNLGSVQDIAAYPFVAESVVNYGIPDMSGQTTASLDVATLERLLQKAIRDFEPRIDRNSIRVRAVVAPDESNHNAIAFEIEGDLWAQPAPVRLQVRTELDLESGNVRVQSAGVREPF